MYVYLLALHTIMKKYINSTENVRSFVAYVIYSVEFGMEFSYNKINCREKLNPSMEHDFVFILFLTLFA